jgi:predicted nucleic acid-binding protein
MITRLLDSVIVIDHLKGVTEAREFMLGLEPEQTAISVITRAEILVGVEEEHEALVKAFLDQFQLLIIDKAVADLAASLRRSRNWKLPDALQAALSIHHRIKLTTRNTKDPRQHDFVEIPFEI